MVLRNRGQLGSFDRALRRERLWDWLGSGGPRFQARRRRARFAVAGFPPGRCRRVVVRQAFEYFKAIARRTGSRSPGANAPNEKWKPALSLSLLPLLWRVNRTSSSIDLIWSCNSGVFWWPCAETACCTAASSTSSPVPEIFSEQFFSLG